MKIGILGAGVVALAVARRALAQGHQVVVSSKSGGNALAAKVATLGTGASAGSVLEAAQAEVVLLAVPWLQVESALAGLPAWMDRILIDATNPYIELKPRLKLADLDGIGASTIVAGQAPGARVVKAFNSLTTASFEKGPTQAGGRRVLFVSGDDPDAKLTVKGLIESFGYAVIDLGSLEAGGRLQQAGGPLGGKNLLLEG
ncbi:MAG: NADPH-dependent F420 reductase [Janthinobacterium lividum]